MLVTQQAYIPYIQDETTMKINKNNNLTTDLSINVLVIKNKKCNSTAMQIILGRIFLL